MLWEWYSLTFSQDRFIIPDIISWALLVPDFNSLQSRCTMGTLSWASWGPFSSFILVRVWGYTHHSNCLKGPWGPLLCLRGTAVLMCILPSPALGSLPASLSDVRASAKTQCQFHDGRPSLLPFKCYSPLPHSTQSGHCHWNPHRLMSNQH